MNKAEQLDRLLLDLERLADRHPEYSGVVERCDDHFRLRYYKPGIEREGDPELYHQWNIAVRALDTIAPRALRLLDVTESELPIGETPSARLMAWLLRDFLNPPGPYQRGTAYAKSNAFDCIREALLGNASKVENLPPSTIGTASNIDHAKQLQALKWWNDGDSWPDVNRKMGRGPDESKSTEMELKRFAEKNSITIRQGKAGSKPKPRMEQ